jgi:hypothetical protein
MAKRRSPSKAHSVVGVAWYEPDQWQQLLDVAVDRDKLEETHDEWVQDAERVIREFQRQGFQVVKVRVKIDELVAWCQRQNISVNGEARSQYAAYKLQQSSK